MGERLTFKQKLYKAIADAAALEHEMVACLILRITHVKEIRSGVHMREVVTIGVRETESLFDVLIEKVAAFRHWVFLDCCVPIGPGWMKHTNSETTEAEFIKPYVDDFLHTLFRIGDPTYYEISLTHNDPRFWDRFWDLMENENRNSRRRDRV